MRTILKGATIIDCINDKPLENYHIIIEEDHILSINKKEQILPEDNIIDFSGKTILPGLINMHVHLTANDQKILIDDMVSKSDEQLLLQAVNSAQLTLKSGVTTVRDCGSRHNLVHWLREAVDKKLIVGPRIVSSGMPLTVTGGSLYFLGMEADGMNEVRKAVRFLTKNGADFIKIMATGARCTPNTDKRAASYTDKELYTAINEAHRNGRKVAIHAHGTVGIKQAVEMGADTIEHCSFITERGMNAEDDILEIIVDKEIIIIPTISAGIHKVFGESFSLDLRYNSYKSPLINYFWQKFDLLKKVYNSGAIILPGNDAGVEGSPHDDFVSELEIMEELGMKKIEVIKSATIKAANALGLDDKIGSIQAGKKADLLVVEGNPLQNIGLLRKPYMVFTDGKIVHT